MKEKGHIHPISSLVDEIVQIFVGMGFEVATGPEMEDEFHNFDALNVPKDHPSRDMQDTFWLKDTDKLLRTHTSNVQIRHMEENKSPLRIISPGRVYRNEATDRTHEVQFHQMEGLVVGKDISLAHLKFALNNLLRKLFGDDIKTQFRPGYFPFVEPGVEIDMECFRCKGKGCSTCSHSGWIEVLGAGMVHPNVLNNVGIDPKKHTGFAFGVGVDRLLMLRHDVDDIRSLYNGDLRSVNQF
ncbi:MAG: phenylalanyl-tRNA synthetase alpha chain [Candidatus Paceibacteria bacterium]|jgi:phenylalanyl-tRNA synthetase alpha chain